MRRLRRLERFKLVTPVADGQWKVAPNLMEILRDCEIERPIGSGAMSDEFLIR